MRRRDPVFNAKTTLLWTLALLLLGFMSPGHARVADVRRTFDQLKDFRRIELRVSPSFKANCRTANRRVNCRLSELPHDFSRLLVSLKGNSLAAVVLSSRAPGRIRVEFEIRKQGIRLQEAVVGTPPIWVIELGTPEILMGPVQVQTPFRPYPIKSVGLPNRIPDIELNPLPKGVVENEKYNRCLELWEQDNLADAQAACGDLAAAFDALACGGTPRCFENVETPGVLPVLDGDTKGRGILLKSLTAGFSPNAHESEAARRTHLVMAELLNALTETDDNRSLPDTSSALERAEKLSVKPLEKARYALLTVDVLERIGYVNRAEELLSRKVMEYKDPESSVYFLAAQARILMQLGESNQAKRVLRQLRELKSNSPIIGLAVLTLAELAYRQKNYVSSLGLFDSVRATWPRVWKGNSTAVFQTAELYMLFGRLKDASEAYQIFSQSRIKMVPDWLVQLREVELLSATDPDAGSKKFRELAISLPKDEAQDLAFLRRASLLKDRAERKRIIKALSTQPTTPFVFEELVVQAIQLALEDGDLEQAFRFARAFWRRSQDADYLERAPQLFDRVLTLEILRRLAADDLYGVLKLFYAEERQIRKHQTTGYIYLLVSRVLRRLGMLEESAFVLQDGLNHKDADEPRRTTAEIYRELATLLRLDKDKFRLSEIDAYLNTRFPKEFDDPEYWLARAYNQAWTGEPKKIATARKMIVYAINGDISDDQRLRLLTRLYEFDLSFGKPAQAVRSIEAFIKEYDRVKRPRISDVRALAFWRISEVWLDQENWKNAVVTIAKFLREYPDHANRVEARFMLARALLNFGDEQQARVYWDIVSREDADGLYGRLARLEMQMLDWESKELPVLLDATQL